MKLLPLQFIDGSHLRIRDERFTKTVSELEEFLSTEKYLNTKEFAKSAMFSHELKANNQIEGYNDDIQLVSDIISKKYGNLDTPQVRRVMNLYHGYKYILGNRDINKESLRKLYSILSNGLLEASDLSRMGKYYRTDKVYILIGGNLSNTPDEGIEAELIDKFMDSYFNFLNNLDYSGDITLEFIKSQILHFYFVYIHPYFDVNGRTSRTVAMWHLLNKKAYPYIIFNRGISFRGSAYV